MEHQLTFADSEFSTKRRLTRKEIFLSRMDALLPWSMLLALIEPVYQRQVMGANLIRCKLCFGSIVYSIGTT